MTILQHTYRKNGYTYVLVERNEHAAIYAQMDGDRVVSYEVGWVKTQAESTIPNGNTIEGGECFWSNEDFGKMAWTITDRARAMVLYADITCEGKEIAAQPVKL